MSPDGHGGQKEGQSTGHAVLAMVLELPSRASKGHQPPPIRTRDRGPADNRRLKGGASHAPEHAATRYRTLEDVHPNTSSSHALDAASRGRLAANNPRTELRPQIALRPNGEGRRLLSSPA